MEATRVDVATGEVFELTPAVAGRVSDKVIAELVLVRNRAKDMAEDYAAAVKEVAAKAKMKPSALKRYVNAVADDKVDALSKETADVDRLLAGS